tara:strand:+ start:1044 stop:1733 length:690 start_codon:yes stop_codon:yes gene_type:complete
MKNLALITARGGSKRILKKNIKNFHDKPIIYYSINTAINSKIFDYVMVSTDDKEISKISKQFGAKVPFYRSKKNSDDYSTTSDVITEVLNELKKINLEFDNVCCIYPTAPFLTDEMLSLSGKILEKEDVDSIISITKFSYPIWRGFKLNSNNSVEYLWPENELKRSQDLPAVYHDAGQFYFFKVSSFLDQKTLIMKKNKAIILSNDKVQDIDTIEDWKIAELKYSLLNK